MSVRRSFLLRPLITFLLSSLAIPAAHAATTYVLSNADTSGSYSWSNTAIWAGGIIASGTDNTADFSECTLSGPLTITLDGNQSVGNLFFGDLGGTYNTTLTAGTGGTLTLAVSSGAPVINVANSALSTTISAVVAGTQGLTKTGNGMLVLTAANAYTGATSVNGGTLKLDFSQSGAPTSNIINSASNLALTNGTLTLVGNAGGAYSQTFNGLAVNSGAGVVTLNQNSATSLSLALGSISQSTGGTLNFSLAPSTSGVVVSTSNVLVNGLLGPWATVGTGTSMQYATVNGGDIVSYTSATTATAALLKGASSATANYTYAAALTLSAVSAANTLQYTGAATTTALGAYTLSLNGLLQTGSGLLTFKGTGGGIQIGSANELTLSGPGSITISAPISNNGSTVSSLTYSGTGTLTLNTAASTYTGITTVNSGTLTLGLANVLNSASSIVVNGGVLGLSTFAQSVNGVTLNGGSITGTTGALTSVTAFNLQGGTISAVLAGNVAINKTSSGTVTISKVATLGTAGVNIQAGTIQLGIAQALTSGNNVTLGSSTANTSGTLDLHGFGQTVALLSSVGTGTNIVTNNGAAAATLTLSGATNFSGIIQDGASPVSVTKMNAGTVTLSGANTFSGIFQINAGIVRLVGGDNRLSTNSTNGVTLGNGSSNSGTLQLGDSSGAVNQTLASLTLTAGDTGLTNAVTGGNGTHTATLTINNTNPDNYAGFLGSGTAGATTANNLALVKSGSGTLTLSNVNTFTGGTTINQGTLAYGVANALTASGTVTVSGGALDLAGYTGMVGSVTLTSGAIVDSVGTGALAGAGYNVQSGTVSAVLADGASPSSLSKATSGLVVLSGANTYTGGTNVSAGTLALGATNALPLAGSVNITGGTLDLAGYGDTVGAFTLASGNVVNSGGAAVLTASSYTVQSGTISAVISGAGSTLTKVSDGSSSGGAVTLSGANTYSGLTTVTGGTLNVFTIHAGGGAFAVGDGATLSVALSAAGQSLVTSALTLGNLSGGNLTLNLGTFGIPTAPIIATGALTLNGVNTLNISAGALSVGEFPLISYTGSILNGGGLVLGTLPARVTASLDTTSVAHEILLNVTGYDIPRWSGAINGNWNVDDGSGTLGTLNWKLSSGIATGYYQGGAVGTDSVLFDDSATGTTHVMLTTALSPISVTVNNSVLNYTFGGSGYLTGATTLTKSGVGTLILANTGANAYTGATTVYAGVLQAGDGAAAGAGQLGAGNIVLNGGILALDRPAGDDFSLGNTVSGTGNLTQEGGDVVTLTGNNMAFTGAFHVTNGTLRLGSVNGFGSAAGSVSGGGILDTTGYSIGNALSFNGGILQATGAATLLSGPVTLSGNGLTVNVSSSATTTLTGTIKGTGPLSLNGGGTLVLSGGSNFVGNVAVNAGVLELGNSSGLGSRVNVVSVASSGTLDVAGYNIGNAIQLNAGTLRTSSGSNGQVGGGIALNGGGAVDVATSAALTLINAISGSGGLTKTSGGTLVLSGGDTYAGGTSVAAGTLVFSSPATLPAGSSISASTGVTVGFGFSLDQSTLASITPTSNAFTIALAANSSNNLNLVGYTSASLGSIGSASYSGVLTPAGTNYNLGGGGGVLTVSSALSGSYGLSVGNTGNGIVLLTGNNSFTGGTTINGGILQIGSATALGSTTSVLTINAAGTLDLNGINTVLSGLSGTGVITDNSQTTGVTQLIVNIASGATYTFTGTISEGSYPTRNVALVKSGAGTLVLNKANADSYYGGTFINGGVLQIRTNNNQVLPYETNITFAGNGTFQAYNNGTGSSTFTLGSLAFNAGLDVVDNYKGSTGAGNTLIFEGGFTRANGAVGNFTLSNGATAPGYITLAPSLPSNQFINGGIYYLGADFIASDSTNGIRALNYTSDQNVANAVLSASATSLAAVVGTSVTGTNLQLSGTGDITDQFSETLNSLKIGGNNNIVLDSSGSGAVLTLTSGGLLKTGGNAAVISGGAGITPASGEDLVVRVAAATDVLNITTSILSSTTGGLTFSGLGMLVLSGNNSYTGPTNILQGTLQIGSATALGAANNGVIIAPTGTLDYAGMSSSQSIQLNGGTLTSSIGTGTVAGTVALQESSGVSASSGAQLVVGASISGAYGVTKTLTGTVVLTADNSYTGGTTISAGTLSLLGSLSSGVTVQKGGTLAQSGVVNGNVVLQSGATYAPGGLSGTGQATVNGLLSVNSGATLSFDIGGTNQGSASGGYDFVTGLTQLSLSGKLSINLVNGFMPTAGESFTLLDWSNLATPGSVTASGYQFDFSNALLAPGLSWDVSQFLTNGTILVDAVVVPEPGRVVLLLVSAIGLLGRRLRRRQ